MSNTKTIKVLIADDHRLVREGIAAMLAGRADIAVVGLAASGAQAINSARELHPDMVLMDVIMPGMNGIEAMRWIKETDETIRVIILSMEVSRDYVNAAMRSGADGYLPKDISSDELATVIRRVWQGRSFFHQAVEKLVLEEVHEESKRTPGRKRLPNQLTKRESEILALVAGGKPNKEISEMLGISIKTVETHRSHILLKLGINNNAEMMRFAVRNKLVSPV